MYFINAMNFILEQSHNTNTITVHANSYSKNNNNKLMKKLTCNQMKLNKA